MDYKKADKLPETLSLVKVETLCNDFLKECHNDYSDQAMEYLYKLADKQWHTYETPSTALKKEVTVWLNKYCDNHAVFNDLVLNIAFSFALEKSFFEKIATQYGEHVLDECSEDLRNSKGNNVDPYWSLRGVD